MHYNLLLTVNGSSEHHQVTPHLAASPGWRKAVYTSCPFRPLPVHIIRQHIIVRLPLCSAATSIDLQASWANLRLLSLLDMLRLRMLLHERCHSEATLNNLEEED